MREHGTDHNTFFSFSEKSDPRFSFTKCSGKFPDEVSRVEKSFQIWKSFEPREMNFENSLAQSYAGGRSQHYNVIHVPLLQHPKADLPFALVTIFRRRFSHFFIFAPNISGEVVIFVAGTRECHELLTMPQSSYPSPQMPLVPVCKL